MTQISILCYLGFYYDCSGHRIQFNGSRSKWENICNLKKMLANIIATSREIMIYGTEIILKAKSMKIISMEYDVHKKTFPF